ncbi:nitroreductase/quinone reductase family protein [Knoellia sp. 3-2P3]|uniref:nitroreductase/quinone reductase family protein n=1 Tax=unclassified Knoellia TaxID=2618719 RepID=UPI0023DC6F1B|nr:nitroreductase/quinone reductase family protein [Knoellia sp. 3-2P3]MDF2094006.1 nitroreductase/quinone reductase family protein [Knoellia sp. 3-2P3]
MTGLRTPSREGTQNTRYLDARWSRDLMALPVVLTRLGLGPLTRRVWMVVTTTGRSSGLPRHVVVYPHVVEGHTYLWCPYGGRAQWYRNLIADPVATVQWRRGTQTVRALPLDDEAEAMRVLRALRRFGGSFFRDYLASQGLADDDEELASGWPRLHVRRLEPTDEPGPAPLRADLAWVWLAPASALAAGLLARRRRH